MTQELLEWEHLGDTIPSGELEGSTRDRLYRFRDSLAVAKDNGFHVLGQDVFEADGPKSKPRNVKAHKAIEEKLLHEGDGLYLSEEYGWLAGEELDSFDVLRTAKAETSANGVFFGVVSDSKTQKGLPVAVKPCEERPGKAYVDWANNAMMGMQGLRTFSPVGFLTKGENTFSITELETDVETLDNSNWQDVLKKMEDPKYDQQRELLRKIGIITGELHGKDIVHNDTQFKNVAVNITGQVFYIDWESAIFLPEGLPQELRIKRMAHDLSVIATSAACRQEEKGVGLLADFSPSLRWEYFRDYVFNPYMDVMLDENDGDDTFFAVTEMEEQLKDFIIDPAQLASKIKSIRKGLR